MLPLPLAVISIIRIIRYLAFRTSTRETNSTKCCVHGILGTGLLAVGSILDHIFMDITLKLVPRVPSHGRDFTETIIMCSRVIVRRGRSTSARIIMVR